MSRPHEWLKEKAIDAGWVVGVGAVALFGIKSLVDGLSIHTPHIPIPKIGRLVEPHVQYDFKAVLTDVHIPYTLPLANTTGKGHSYVVSNPKSHTGFGIGWAYNHSVRYTTGCSAWVTRQEHTEVDMPYTAVKDTYTRVLPGSTTSKPKVELDVDIDATKLQTHRMDQATLGHGGNCAIGTNVANVVTDSEAHGNIPVVLTDVTDQETQATCDQAVAPDIAAQAGLAFNRLLNFAGGMLSKEVAASPSPQAKAALNSLRELASQHVRVHLWLPSQSTEMDPIGLRLTPPSGMPLRNYQPDPIGELAAGLHVHRDDITEYKTNSFTCTPNSVAAGQLRAFQTAYTNQLFAGATKSENPGT